MALLVCGGAMVHVGGQKLSDMIKKSIISEVFEPDPGLAASAIRLSFHDCVGDDGPLKSCVFFGADNVIRLTLDAPKKTQLKRRTLIIVVSTAWVWNGNFFKGPRAATGVSISGRRQMPGWAGSSTGWRRTI